MKTLGQAILFVLVVGFGLALLYTPSHPSTPSTVTAESATPVLPPVNPARSAKCLSALQELDRSVAAWRRYQYLGDGQGTVEVGPAYYAVTFDDKQTIDAAMRCVLSRGREGSVGLSYVSYLDPFTHKEIAKWSDATGFSVN